MEGGLGWLLMHGYLHSLRMGQFKDDGNQMMRDWNHIQRLRLLKLFAQFKKGFYIYWYTLRMQSERNNLFMFSIAVHGIQTGWDEKVKYCWI